jgi:AcrR family transcriptional regulator
MDEGPSKTVRSRRSPAERRAEIMTRAAALVLEQGALPVSLDRLAQEVGVSKALIYNYFPTQHDLFNALLGQEFQALRLRGIEAAATLAPVEAAALACAHIYFDHVAERGPVIHLILRDRFMARRLSPDVARFRDRLVLRLARASRRELRLSAKENIAAINLVITIPEEAGRLAYRGDIERERGRDLCGELVLSSLQALSPRSPP